MEPATLFYIITAISIIILFYSVVKYFTHPRRKLLQAKDENSFYLLDNQPMEFTYKGCLFTGKKELGLTNHKFHVTSISIVVNDPADLIGFTNNDLHFLEEKLTDYYPEANFEWQSPINQLFQQNA